MNRLIDLLEQGRQDGYPTDYLLARLRARTRTFADRCPAGRGEEAWLELQYEYGWLFRQMNVALRIKLAPVFFYFELRNLFAALRFSAGTDRASLKTTLAASLLGPQLQTILKQDHSFPTKLNELSRLLAGYGAGFSPLDEVWHRRGLPGLETALLKDFSRIIRREQPPPAVRAFLARLLNRRHLLLLAKEQRWQPQESLLGGDHHPARHRRHLSRYLEQLNRQEPGVADDPALLDTLLLRTLLRDCRRTARTSKTLAMFLAYLCSCWLTARDCGVRGLVPLLGETRISTELVV